MRLIGIRVRIIMSTMIQTTQVLNISIPLEMIQGQVYGSECTYTSDPSVNAYHPIEIALIPYTKINVTWYNKMAK